MQGEEGETEGDRENKGHLTDSTYKLASFSIKASVIDPKGKPRAGSA